MSSGKKAAATRRELATQAQDELVRVLEARFEKHRDRHPNIEWSRVLTRLNSAPEKLWSLHKMEATGGEPDVVAMDKKTGEVVFFDCSPESPKGRAGVCYDREGLESRKEHKPKHNALDLAAEMGVEMLTVDEYHQLQELGEFDTKTSSWVKTPEEIRALGGALFGDRRYGRVFIYHNGAQSYYGARGFRASLRA
jgi:hypothetical protein